MNHLKLEYIGDVAVDTGMVLIADPFSVYNPNPTTRDGNRTAYMERRRMECIDRTELAGAGETLHGVVATTYAGDGVFPVFADLDSNGNIERLIIEFKEPNPFTEEGH